MKQQEVFKKIGIIIKELSDQYEYLKTIDGQLNELELELFIANSHFLTDHVVILNKLNSQLSPAPAPVEKESPLAEEKPPVVEEKQPEPEPELVEEPSAPEPEPKYFEPLVQSVAQPIKKHDLTTEDNQPVPQIDLGTSSDEDSFSFVRQEPETIRHELILDEADWIEDEAYENELIEPIIADEIIEAPPAIAKTIEVEKIEELKPVITPQPKPIVETVKHTAKEEVLTINERMSAQLTGKTGNFAEQAVSQKINDLKQAINLNDKMLYVKDLFNGYSLAYSEAIEILNRFNSFEEADTFLKKNYVVKNTWESKPETTDKFYNLLKRRYE